MNRAEHGARSGKRRAEGQSQLSIECMLEPFLFDSLQEIANRFLFCKFWHLRARATQLPFPRSASLT